MRLRDIHSCGGPTFRLFRILVWGNGVSVNSEIKSLNSFDIIVPVDSGTIFRL